MAERETPNKPKSIIEPVPEELENLEKEIEKSDMPIEQPKEKISEAEEERQSAISRWIPKTNLGREVKEGKITSIDNILSSGRRILEPEIADALLRIETDLLLIGQAKGKFGGGKRRAWRQTQKKTMEGNVVTFSSMAVVGDRKGHIGIGYGKSKETLPARAKALRKAKLNIIRITRGHESPDERNISEPHTVPFIVRGKSGSVRIKLIPAPRGTGLVVSSECKKILSLAGIKDVYGVTKGQTRTTFNLAKACIDALNKTNYFEK